MRTLTSLAIILAFVYFSDINVWFIFAFAYLVGRADLTARKIDQLRKDIEVVNTETNEA